LTQTPGSYLRQASSSRYANPYWPFCLNGSFLDFKKSIAETQHSQLDVRFTFSTSEDITLTENLSLSDIATNGAPRIEFEGRTYWLYSDAEVRRSIEKLEDSETTSIKHVDQSHDGNREFFVSVALASDANGLTPSQVECQTSNPEDAWPGLLNLCDRYIR
jgi:hypothetical protein